MGLVEALLFVGLVCVVALVTVVSVAVLLVGLVMGIVVVKIMGASVFVLTEWSTRLVVSNLVAVRAVVLLVDGTVALVGSVVVVGVLLVRSVNAGSIAVESSITATSLASNRLVLAINTVESIKSTNLAVGLDVATATNTTEVLLVTALVLVETLDSLNVTEVSDTASLTGVKLGLVGHMLLLAVQAMGEVEVLFMDALASIKSLKTMSLGDV